MNLSFGLSHAIPPTVATAWGARLIFPDDLVWDRQDIQGEERLVLAAWLNEQGALRAALKEARRLADRRLIRRDGAQRVILLRDAAGIVVACPNNSCGYLYVAGWLHLGEAAKLPDASYTQPTDPDRRASTSLAYRT